jgi:hypothetical protein
MFRGRKKAGGNLRKIITKKETLDLADNVLITARNVKTGKIIHQERQHNLIVLDGRNLIRDLLGGNTNNNLSHFAIGTNGISTADSMSALQSEIFRNTITRFDFENNKLIINYFLASNEANGNTIQEAGIFNAASGGTMYARVIQSAIEKNENISITYSWTTNILSIGG